MHIRLFANTNDKGKAILVFENAISGIENYIKRKEVSAEPYWKIEDVYVVDADIELETDLTEKGLKEFLYSIADTWLFFGNPNNEALASDTTDGCRFLKNGIRLINVFY